MCPNKSFLGYEFQFGLALVFIIAVSQFAHLHVASAYSIQSKEAIGERRRQFKKTGSVRRRTSMKKSSNIRI
jgi:hypothetical protein